MLSPVVAIVTIDVYARRSVGDTRPRGSTASTTCKTWYDGFFRVGPSDAGYTILVQTRYRNNLPKELVRADADKAAAGVAEAQTDEIRISSSSTLRTNVLEWMRNPANAEHATIVCSDDPLLPDHIAAASSSSSSSSGAASASGGSASGAASASGASASGAASDTRALITDDNSRSETADMPMDFMCISQTTGIERSHDDLLADFASSSTATTTTPTTTPTTTNTTTTTTRAGTAVTRCQQP